jgi:hypothetical protein
MFLEERARKADNLAAICEATLWKMWSQRLTTLRAQAASYMISFTF